MCYFSQTCNEKQNYPVYICWFKFLDNLCSICWSYSCCFWCSSVLPVHVWHSTLSSNISWQNRYCLLLMRKTLTLTAVTMQNIHKNITARQFNNFLTWILCFLVISFLSKFHPCAPSAKVIVSLVNVLKLEDCCTPILLLFVPQKSVWDVFMFFARSANTWVSLWHLFICYISKVTKQV